MPVMTLPPEHPTAARRNAIQWADALEGWGRLVIPRLVFPPEVHQMVARTGITIGALVHIRVIWPHLAPRRQDMRQWLPAAANLVNVAMWHIPLRLQADQPAETRAATRAVRALEAAVRQPEAYREIVASTLTQQNLLPPTGESELFTAFPSVPRTPELDVALEADGWTALERMRVAAPGVRFRVALASNVYLRTLVSLLGLGDGTTVPIREAITAIERGLAPLRMRIYVEFDNVAVESRHNRPRGDGGGGGGAPPPHQQGDFQPRRLLSTPITPDTGFVIVAVDPYEVLDRLNRDHGLPFNLEGVFQHLIVLQNLGATEFLRYLPAGAAAAPLLVQPRAGPTQRDHVVVLRAPQLTWDEHIPAHALGEALLGRFGPLVHLPGVTALVFEPLAMRPNWLLPHFADAAAANRFLDDWEGRAVHLQEVLQLVGEDQRPQVLRAPPSLFAGLPRNTLNSALREYYPTDPPPHQSGRGGGRGGGGRGKGGQGRGGGPKHRQDRTPQPAEQAKAAQSATQTALTDARGQAVDQELITPGAAAAQGVTQWTFGPLGGQPAGTPAPTTLVVLRQGGGNQPANQVARRSGGADGALAPPEVMNLLVEATRRIQQLERGQLERDARLERQMLDMETRVLDRVGAEQDQRLTQRLAEFETNSALNLATMVDTQVRGLGETLAGNLAHEFQTRDQQQADNLQGMIAAQLPGQLAAQLPTHLAAIPELTTLQTQLQGMQNQMAADRHNALTPASMRALLAEMLGSRLDNTEGRKSHKRRSDCLPGAAGGRRTSPSPSRTAPSLSPATALGGAAATPTSPSEAGAGPSSEPNMDLDKDGAESGAGF